MTEEQTHIGITLGDPAGGSSHDGLVSAAARARASCNMLFQISSSVMSCSPSSPLWLGAGV